MRAGALAADFAGTGLAGASSEDSSDSSSLESSLELDSAAGVAFGGGAFGVLLETLVGAAFGGAVFGCEALGVNFGGSSESLSLDSEDESLVAVGFVWATFLLVIFTTGSTSESLSLDESDGEGAFGGGILDFCSRVKLCQFIDLRSCALFHWSPEVLQWAFHPQMKNLKTIH